MRIIKTKKELIAELNNLPDDTFIIIGNPVKVVGRVGVVVEIRGKNLEKVILLREIR